MQRRLIAKLKPIAGFSTTTCRKKSACVGFTLIEVLAATTLASVLIVAVMGIMISISHQWRLYKQPSTAPTWKQRLEERLRWDFGNARLISWDPSMITLVGFGSRSFSNGLAELRPAQVTYRIKEEAGSSWLLRREEHLDLHSNRNATTEIVCRSVTRFELLSPDGERELETRESAVPAALRLVLYDEMREIVRLDLILHANVNEDDAQ